MRKFVFITIAITLFTFSITAKKTAVYSIPLTLVENNVSKYSESDRIDILASDDNGLLRSQYEDSLIQIIWKCDGKRFWFNLLNKTNYPITIDWDNIVFIDTDSEIGNVIHSGTKYIDRNNGQLKTIVPRKAKISDFLVPSKNCVFNQGGVFYHRWMARKLPVPMCLQKSKNIGSGRT